MKHMKKTALLTATVLMLTLVGSLPAQESADPPQFLQETLQYMQQYGWSEAQLEQFRRAAMEQNWDDIEAAEPEIVALALRLANQNRAQLQAAENADLALELAYMARTMQRLGFQGRALAEAAFEGTRQIVRNMEQVRSQIRVHADDGTGEALRVRERIRERIREHLDETMEKQVQAQERAAQQKRQVAEGKEVPAGKPQNIPGGRN